MYLQIFVKLLKKIITLLKLFKEKYNLIVNFNLNTMECSLKINSNKQNIRCFEKKIEYIIAEFGTFCNILICFHQVDEFVYILVIRFLTNMTTRVK